MPTLEFTFTISAANLTRVVQGVAYQNNYQDFVEDPENPDEMIPNPETKGQFAKRMVKGYIKNCTTAWEANQASETARLAAIADAEAIEIS